MQFLGQVFEYVLGKRGATLNILGATSGDTGSAAEYALRGKRGVSVFMLSPHGRMSAFQRAQMYSLQDENIHNIAVRGVFDQAQDIVKALAGDLDFKTRYRLGAVNSINWARIAAQVVYYFHGWLRATSKAGDQVSFAVPSVTSATSCRATLPAAWGCRCAGWCWPRTRTTCWKSSSAPASTVRVRPSRPTPRPARPWTSRARPTSSASCSIWWAATRPRAGAVGRPARDGAFDLSALKPEFESRYGFVSGASTHADRLATIRSVYDESGVLVDPHTADGVKVAREVRRAGRAHAGAGNRLAGQVLRDHRGSAGPSGRAARQSGGPGIAAAARRVMDCDAAPCGATSRPTPRCDAGSRWPCNGCLRYVSPENPPGASRGVFRCFPGKGRATRRSRGV